MSNWLKNVGTFLERLDDQAERVVTEEDGLDNLDGNDGGDGDGGDDEEGIASILAARGLSGALVDENDMDDHDGDGVDDEQQKQQQQQGTGNDIVNSALDNTVNSESNKEETHGVVLGFPKNIPELSSSSSPIPSTSVTTPANGESGEGWDEDNLSEHIVFTEDTEPLSHNVEITTRNATIPRNTNDGDNESSLEQVNVVGTGGNEPSTVSVIAPHPEETNPEKNTTTPTAVVAETPHANDDGDDIVTEVISKSPISDPIHTKERIIAETQITAPSTAGAELPTFRSVTTSIPTAHGSSRTTGDDDAVAVASRVAPAPEVPPSTNKTSSIQSHNTTTAAKNYQGQQQQKQQQQQQQQQKQQQQQQKEVRTLRRSIVSLNTQLEAAETELGAQREELERAAERMEKDRIRAKEERERERLRHANEMKSMQQKNERALKEARARADAQIEQIREQLRQVEDRRMQEGGDWNKELADAIRREKEMSEKFRCAEEERNTLLNQITILQNQQESLGSRLESLSQTADNAMEREREADQRLDDALTLHAKQISQRQAREAELERTIAELGQALVQARSRTPAKAERGGNDEAASSRLQSAEHEIESLRNQLQYESQRANSLQIELEDLSNERAQDATVSHKQQRQYEREINDLKNKLSTLEAQLRSSKEDPESGKKPGGVSKDDQENLRQIKQLSEEVLRQREKITDSSSEISALKSRLKAATDRANKAESALESAQLQDMEATPGSMRRRKRGRSPKPETIRAALNLDGLSHSDSTERIGKALDGIDAFLVQSTKILRYQPLARLLFILYLIMIHVWTFFLIFVHAHGYETVHGDFGGGHGVPHGPHALMNNPVVPVNPAAELEQSEQHN